MNITVQKQRLTSSTEICRFVFVGIVATVVHFSVLFLLRDVAGVHIALANWFGSVIGIITSYCGNAVWVFQSRTPATGVDDRLHANLTGSTAVRFAVLYFLISVGHGLGLWLFTTVTPWPYQLGFCLLTALSTIASFLGNKYFVFASRNTAH